MVLVRCRGLPTAASFSRSLFLFVSTSSNGMRPTYAARKPTSRFFCGPPSSFQDAKHAFVSLTKLFEGGARNTVKAIDRDRCHCRHTVHYIFAYEALTPYDYYYDSVLSRPYCVPTVAASKPALRFFLW